MLYGFDTGHTASIMTLNDWLSKRDTMALKTKIKGIIQWTLKS